MEIISAWELYLWTRLDVFDSGLWSFVSCLLVVVSVAFAFMGNVAWHSDDDKAIAVYMKGKLKTLVVISAVMISLGFLVPTKKEMAMIYVLPKLANSQQIQTEASEIYDIAKSALKEYAGVKEDE